MLKTKELFVYKTKLISESTEKIIELHDFIDNIEDIDKKMIKIRSPKFKLAGVDFTIDVYPDCREVGYPGYIGVSLRNHSYEDQTTSISFKEASGKEDSRAMGKVEAGKKIGFFQFLSHKSYRRWAKDHGDVLKLEVVVTLHSPPGWTR